MRKQARATAISSRSKRPRATPAGSATSSPRSEGRAGADSPQAAPAANRIVFGDNLGALRTIADESVDLIYIDPPFNTGRDRAHTRIRAQRIAGAGPAEGRIGFAGARYHEITIGTRRFADAFDDYLAFLEPRLLEAKRVLKPTGSLYFHIDQRESHYCKVLLDHIFGRRCFLNEIIWAYDYGGRGDRRWPAKHDALFLYVKDPRRHTFNLDAVDRIPYMAPGLVGPEKAARGKTPTDVWWHTIVPTSGPERTGYPTQKPLGILRRIVTVSSNPGDLVLDFFAGSGTTGAACLELGRRFILVDDNPEALEVMARRFEEARDLEWIGWPPEAAAGNAPRAMVEATGLKRAARMAGGEAAS